MASGILADGRTQIAMTLSRRAFVRGLGISGAGALVAPAIAARGREALWAAMTAGAAQTAHSPIRLDSNENPRGPGEAAFAGIRDALGETSRYPDRPQEVLREAAARAHGVAADSVLVGCGSTEILKMAVDRFTTPQRGLVTAAPTFEAPARFAERIGSPVIEVPVDSALKLDLDAMAAKAAGAGLVYVCNPNNPTSTAHAADAVRQLVTRVATASPGTTILIDEAYFEYVEDARCATAIPLAMSNPRVVVSRTFSKAYGLAGLRVGYAVGDAATLEALATRRVPDGINLLGAAAATAALADASFIARERRLNGEARAFTRAFFESAGFGVVPGETNFMMVDIRRDAGAFRDACRGRSVLIGRRFPPLPTHARITIGTMEEMQRAVAVFREILKPA